MSSLSHDIHYMEIFFQNNLTLYFLLLYFETSSAYLFKYHLLLLCVYKYEQKHM